MLNLIASLFFLSAAISLRLLFVFWKHRDAGDWARPLLLIALSSVIWASAQGMELLAPTLSGKLFWGPLQYFGIVGLAPAWFVLAIGRTNNRSKLTGRVYAGLMVVPLITLSLIFTNKWHGLIWSSVTLNTDFMFPVLDITYGSWFMLQTLYTIVLQLIGVWALVGSYGRHSKIYRQQNYLLLTAMLVPFSTVIFRVIGVSFFQNVDVAPLLLAVSVGLLAVFTLTFGLFDIAPIARMMVLNNLNVGVVIINNQNLIVELNSIARTILGMPDVDFAGQNAEKLHKYLVGFDPVYTNDVVVHQEIKTERDGDVYYYDVAVSVMDDDTGEAHGHIIILTDITKRRQAEATVRENERRYRLLADNATDMIWTLDNNFRATYTNPSVIRYRGYSVEEALAQTIEEILPPSSIEKIMPIFSEARRAMEKVEAKDLRDISYAVELENYCKDGSLITVDVTLAFLLGTEGEPLGLIGSSRNITERKEAEAKLYAAEQRYRLLAENSADIIWTLDKDLQPTYISPAVTVHLGYTPEEAMAQPLEQRVPPSSFKKLKPLLDEARVAVKTMTADELRPLSYTAEVENYCKDGSTITVDLRMSFFFDQEGEILGLIGSSRNISERKKAEAAVHDAEMRYRLLAEHSTDIIWTMDMNMNHTYVSPSVQRHLGYTPKEMKSLTFDDLMVPASLDKIFQQFSGILTSKDHITVEVEQYHKDGRLIPMEINMTILRDEDDEPTGLTGSSRNISERREAEAAMRESERRYRMLADNATDIIWTADLDMNFTYISPSVERYRGYRVEEALALTIEETLPPDSLEKVMNVFADVMSHKYDEAEASNAAVMMELENYCKDGSVIPIETHMAFLLDTMGNPDGIIGSSRIITERKEAEEAIQRQNIFLNTVINSLSSPFYVINVEDYSIQIANKTAREMGVRTAKTCYALTHWRDSPCDNADHPCPLRTLRNTRKPVTVEHIHFDMDGKPHNMEVHAYPIFNDAGEVVQMIEYSIDITERKKAEAQFHQLSRAVEQSGSSIVITNMEGVIEFVNPAFTRTAGYLPEEVIGRNPRMLQSGHHPPQFYEEMWKILLKGDTWHGEMVNKKKDGTLYWEHVIISPITDTRGEVTGYLAIKDDISDRKLAEEQIRQLSRAVEQSGSSIVITDLDGTITFVNPAFSEITGYSKEEAIGQNPRILKSGKHSDEFYEEMWLTLMNGRVWQGEILNARKDGSTFWEHSSISPVTDANGVTTHYLAIKDDISDRKRADAETKLLLSMSEAIHNAPDYYAALQAAVTLTGAYADWMYGEVWIPNDEKTYLINSGIFYTCEEGIAGLDIFKSESQTYTFALDEGLPGRIWASHETEWLRDIVSEPVESYHRVESARAAGLAAALGVPVIAAGELLAVAVFYMAEPTDEDDRVVEVVTAVAIQLGTTLQQKMAQAALTENESQLRRLTDNISDFIFQTDAYGILEYISPSWTRGLGYAEEDVLGTSIIDYLHPDDVDVISVIFVESIASGASTHAEFHFQHKDGHYLYLSANSRVLTDAYGEFVGSVFGAIDITERKRAEAEADLLLLVSNGLLNAPDFDAALEVTLRLSVEHTGWIFGEAWVPSKKGSTLIYSDMHYYRQVDDVSLHRYAQLSKELIFASGEGIPGRVWASHQLEWVEDISDESTNQYHIQLVREAGLRAVLTVPVLAAGKVLVVLLFYVDNIRLENERVVKLIMAVAAQLGSSLQQKMAQTALAENERHLRRLTDNITDIIIQADRYGILEYVSPSCTRNLGYMDEDIIGTSVFDYMTSDGAARVMQSIFNSMRCGQPARVEFRFQHKRGHYLYMSASGMPLMNEKGKLTGTIFGVTDITKRKQAEDKLQLAYEGIEKRVEELTAVNSLIQEMSRTTNLQDALDLVSRTMAERLNSFQCGIALLNEEKTGMTVAAQYSTNLTHPDPIGLIFPLEGNVYTRQVFETKKPVYMPYAQTSDKVESLTRQTMREQGIGSTLLLPLMARGEVIGTIGIDSELPDRAFDEEEIVLAETIAAQVANAISTARILSERKKAQQEAEKANRAKSVFLANMSHELRTPMNAILGFAQLMQRDSTLTPVQTERLRTIDRSGKHLLDLINDVLEMSKIEAGRMELHENSFDLHKLLADIALLLQVRVQEKNLSLDIDYPLDLPQFIHADEAKLRQILINLMGNAIKFTNEGGVHVLAQHSIGRKSVSPYLTDTGTLKELYYTLTFTVIDSGVGIDVDELATIFDPFIQASNKQGQQGTGLGLPISQRFVQMMGGDMYAENKFDGGAIFTFDIQASSAQADEVLVTERLRQVVGLVDGQKTYRILIAEDDETNRILLTQILEPIGFEVRWAENGRVAVNHAMRWRPDIILMDMRMPLMDGLEATHRIKAKRPEIPIIALTAGAFDHDRNAALSAGCNDFLTKPVNVQVLFQLMRKYGGMEYVYNNEEEDVNAVSQDNDAPLSPEQLAVIPATLRDELHIAIIMADRRQAGELIEKIREEHGRLADRLDALLREFQFDKLAELTK